MRADVQVSTKFLTTQNAHQLGVLTTLSGDAPLTRAPINVVLVIDRSGSMEGEPLAAAREAARRFAGFLGRNDRLGVVAFNNDAAVVSTPAPAGNPAIIDAIDSIQADGGTNLSAGWLKAFELVREGLVEGVNRVVLLTDGQANLGITDIDALSAMARGGTQSRVSTTCIGFGADFNEDLLHAMGQGGQGNYWYVERDDQMAGVFEGEIEGLVALAAQNVTVEVRLVHPKASGVTFLQRYPITRTVDGGWSASLGDLYATSPLALGLIVHMDELETLGVVPVAEVRCIADVVLAGGIEHRVITQVLQANLDGADHPQPLVEKTFLRFAAAAAREDAIKLADAGDLEGAAVACERVWALFDAYGDDPDMVQQREDLVQEAARLREEAYTPQNRKYMQAFSMAASEGKRAYADKIRRPRREK